MRPASPGLCALALAKAPGLLLGPILRPSLYSHPACHTPTWPENEPISQVRAQSPQIGPLLPHRQDFQAGQKLLERRAPEGALQSPHERPRA